MTLQRANLVDLATFGIHVHNPEQQCCKCKASVRGQTEGIFADELCGSCSKIGTRARWRHRRRVQFYTPKSVYVEKPQEHRSGARVVSQGVVQPQRATTSFACTVKIDGVLYHGRNRGNYVALYDMDGLRVREFGLQLTQEHLAGIYAAQQRSS